jgi:hypothetical protein
LIRRAVDTILSFREHILHLDRIYITSIPEKIYPHVKIYANSMCVFNIDIFFNFAMKLRSYVLIGVNIKFLETFKCTVTDNLQVLRWKKNEEITLNVHAGSFKTGSSRSCCAC